MAKFGFAEGQASAQRQASMPSICMHWVFQRHHTATTIFLQSNMQTELRPTWVGAIVPRPSRPRGPQPFMQHSSAASWSAYQSAAAGRHKRQRTLSRPAASQHPPPQQLPVAEAPKKRLAVFVSGGGSNFKAIHAAILEGRVNAEVAVVVSNAPTCGGVQYAQSHGIPTLTYPAPKADPSAGLSSEQLMDALTQEHAADYVILAGYLKLIPSALVRAYKRAILNIHPALLPSFGGKGYYGQRVHTAVVASGARFSGPSIHFVDEEYDTGPILAQAVVPVYPTDTPQQLAARVLKEEHKLYPQCVSALVDGRITWREDGIPIMWSAH